MHCKVGGAIPVHLWENQMDKKIAGLLGAAAALATVSGAQASTQPQAG